MVKRSFSLVHIVFLCFALHAQQPQVYNQFFMNPYIYNPAYAGVEGHAAIFAMYRNQWTNVETAPTTSHVSFQVPLQGGIALGGAAFNITQGLLNTSAVKVSGAYLIVIDRTHFIRFGMSLGTGMNRVNITEFDSPGDPAFEDFLDNSIFFLGDFGLTYHFGHFNVGFALPNLFAYNPITQKEVSEVGFSPYDNILLKMNYRGHISDDFAIEPHLIYRYSNIVPHQYEGALIAHLYHIVWVGASYRQDAGIIALAGAKIKEKIGIGLSYELGNSQIATELGPTLEVNVGYHLGIRKEHAKHVSSFIKSHRLTAEERAEKAELERQKQLAELEKEKEPVEEEDTPSTNTPEKPTNQWYQEKDVENFRRIGPNGEEEIGFRFKKEGVSPDGKNVIVSWVPVSDTKNLKAQEGEVLERVLPDGSTEIGIRYQKTNPDGSVEEFVKWSKVITEQQAEMMGENPNLTKEHYEQIVKSDPELTNDFRTHEELGVADNHVVAKRGNHFLELAKGNFVIAGAFSDFGHAQIYSDKLFKVGFHDTVVGYSSARGYYYVVVYESRDIEQARAKRDQFRKTTELSNAWILQMEE